MRRSGRKNSCHTDVRLFQSADGLHSTNLTHSLIHSPFSQSIHTFFNLSIHLLIRPPSSLHFTYPSFHPSFPPSTQPFTHQFIHPPIYSSIHPPALQTVHSSVNPRINSSTIKSINHKGFIFVGSSLIPIPRTAINIVRSRTMEWVAKKMSLFSPKPGIEPSTFESRIDWPARKMANKELLYLQQSRRSKFRRFLPLFFLSHLLC